MLILRPASAVRLPCATGVAALHDGIMEIITTHKNTDFDAFASIIAATLVYPDAFAVLPQIINPNVKAFLSIHKDLFTTRNTKEIDWEDLRRLVLVDVNRWDRLDRFERLRDRAGLEIHLWYHHMDPGDVEAAEPQ